MIFDQDATAKYICRKLYRWFVDYIIDADVEQNVITPMASMLRANNYDIKPVMLALFKSAHFFDPARYGAVIKAPSDLMIGTFRLFGVEFPGSTATDYIRTYYAWIGVSRTIAPMGMALFAHPNVAGWPAYYQSPSYHELWINSDTLQKRVKFTNDLAMDGYDLPENNENALIDVIAFAKNVSDPTNPRTIVNEWATLLFPTALTQAQQDLLRDVLIPGLPDYEWTSEWNDYLRDPTNNAGPVTEKLRLLLKYMLAMAEYQLS
jgi:hypothetical protein